MAAKAKYSKKMFENLDRAEVRKLAIVGMKLAPAKAYTFDFKTLVSWVYDRATEVPSDEVNGDQDRDPRPFTEVDLEDVGNEAFRDGVMFYISELQEFVRGNAPNAPSWPPEGGVANEESVDEQEPIEAKAVPAETAEAPPKRKRGRPRKIPVVTETESAVITETKSTVVKETPKKAPIAAKIKIKKAKLSTKSAPTTSDTASETFDVAAMVASIENLTERVADLNNTVSNISAYTNGLAEGIKDGFSTVSAQVTAVRAEQTAANNLLGNALLFLMNSVVFDEGEEKVDLAGIPEPNSYLDLD